MAIRRFYNRSVIIRRLAMVSGNRKNYVATATWDSHIQRVTDEDDTEAFGVYGATHKMWLDITVNIQLGDKIIDSDNVEYKVVGVVKEGQNIAMNEHTVVFMKELTS